ncbi:hypothetical protein C9I99_03790 [Photobacterium lutimaris]|uniref:Uncharacterized protein n=1 Tax=Photobacterium lutimaris TaxID=388278 RepID=A0A2T3J4A4_9GAMM|nr:hypothetical protein C9I99_03790 [Photobacterium lutimaris]TDR79244.1 hypothetical protein DFP78_101760 [Photobacterium lutimaris]
MFVWIGIVSGTLIASSFTSGLISAVLDFVAFIIIMCLGARRLKQKNQRNSPRESKAHVKPAKGSAEFKEELKHIKNESDRISITP